MNEELFFKGSDGKTIHACCWSTTVESIGVVQILHGMAEHAERYEHFASFLNDKGFIVYANNHRGHGKTAGTLSEVGFIGDDGFNKIVEDVHILTQIIKEKHSNLPVFILGHSFGSFLAQEYIMRYGSEISGLILTGSALKDGFDVKMGAGLAGIMLLFGAKKKNRLLDTLSFGSYNKKIEKPVSKFAWLSSDDEEVKKYDDDPFCGSVFSTNFFYWFSKGLTELYKHNKVSTIPHSLPILILSGQDDPVGTYGKNVEKLYEMYKKSGIIDVNCKLYPNLRHEILNEVDKELVYKDIYDWIKNEMNK